MPFVPHRLGVALLLAALLCAPAPSSAAESKAAPPLSATLLDGSGYSSIAQRGKVILVNFWATWCTPCREEMPAIEAFYARYRTKGLEVIAISMDEAGDAGKVRQVAQSYSFPVALAAQASYRGFGRIWRLPMTFVIDRQGRLRDELTAKVAKLDSEFLEAHIAPLLAP